MPSRLSPPDRASPASITAVEDSPRVAADARRRLPWLRGGRPGRATLGVLAILKNEALNLREWVDHYRWQGASRLFLIDNGSTDGGRALVEREIADGFVEWYRRPRRHAQVAHYREVFRRAAVRRKVEWLAVADLDEFWYAPRSTLREELERVGGLDLIYANWRNFGSGGWNEHPPSLRRCITRRFPEYGQHACTKWIVRTDAVWLPWQLRIHKVRHVASDRVVSDNVTFRLAHYPIQSLRYFTEVKMTRGDVSTRRSDSLRDLAYFETYDARATVEDRELADLVERAEAGGRAAEGEGPPP